MILKCTNCGGQQGSGPEYQNDTYGWGNRVHNRTGKDSKPAVYRCTVCGAERHAQ